MGWVDEKEQDSVQDRMYSPKFLALRGSSLFKFTAPPVGFHSACTRVTHSLCVVTDVTPLNRGGGNEWGFIQYHVLSKEKYFPVWKEGSGSAIIICATLIFHMIDGDHLMCLHSARLLGDYDEKDKPSMLLEMGRDWYMTKIVCSMWMCWYKWKMLMWVDGGTEEPACTEVKLLYYWQLTCEKYLGYLDCQMNWTVIYS